MKMNDMQDTTKLKELYYEHRPTIRNPIDRLTCPRQFMALMKDMSVEDFMREIHKIKEKVSKLPASERSYLTNFMNFLMKKANQ